MDLGADWRYCEGDLPSAAIEDQPAALWTGVTVPHTWNAEDGADGGTTKETPGYRRGPAWYQRDLVLPSDLKGRRAFLVFEGASMVSDVHLNGTHLGQHRGAFNAFSFEITPHLDPGRTNDLRVRVDNTFVADVPPLAGDFTMFGGLYRPVKLLLTSETCITPLDHASSGVFLAQREVGRERAFVDARVRLSRGGDDGAPVHVRVSVVERDGVVAEVQEAPVAWAGTQGETQVSLLIERPHLWRGWADPYLYAARVELLREDQVIDTVTQPLGLRSVRVDPERGFVLNGEPYELRGVCRHQDRAGKGWALTDADHEADLAMILEMGANAVRLAHYPHAPRFYELCDRAGLIVWAEIPLVNVVRNTDAFHANTKLQLIEMIRQHGNHPSIVMWGLFNELYHQGPSDPCEDLVEELNALAQTEDPTRPTVAASNQRSRTALNAIPDLIAFNGYPGWYGNGGPSGMSGSLEAWLEATGHRGIGVSEYGAGGSIRHQEEWPPKKPVHNGDWHPEQYQAFCHEAQYAAIRERDDVWGSFIWNMFDFGSDDRAEGDQPGINDKGLVTYDRQTRKDAFYFYKANWNPEPMVHLLSRRHATREHRATTVRAYANCDTVELFVNDRSLGAVQPDALSRVEWKAVILTTGENRIRVCGRRGEWEWWDEAVWFLRLAQSAMSDSLTQ
jgi:beta-galactosidase